MKTYIKFIISQFVKNFLYVFLIIFSFVFILNILSELEFFRDFDKTGTYLPIYLSILNSPSVIFEMSPFIILLSTQVFFINLFKDNQIQIFKYSGLKNSKIITILGTTTFVIGLFSIVFFYNFSSKLKNVYLEIKNNYSSDDKYLAVITKNGLWIKDITNHTINIIHSSGIEKNHLVDSFITEFDNEFNIQKNISSDKINIINNEWLAYEASLIENNSSEKVSNYKIFSNFDYKKIQSLFSNLSSLSLMKLHELRKNYIILKYSTTEVSIQILKILTFPVYLTLMTILSSIIMFSTKSLSSTSLKISIGLFFSVIIYYLNNFFNILGKTEKISVIMSISIPIIILIIANTLLIKSVNEK